MILFILAIYSGYNNINEIYYKYNINITVSYIIYYIIIMYHIEIFFTGVINEELMCLQKEITFSMSKTILT